MTHRALFFYGTLRDPDILAAVIARTPSPAALIAASAVDHAALYLPDRVYPGLVPRRGAVAPGLLMMTATEADRRALDAFEGDEYRRGLVQVSTPDGTIEAEAYFPRVAIPDTAPEWSLQIWTLHHKPGVIADEIDTAQAIRRRLSAQRTA